MKFDFFSEKTKKNIVGFVGLLIVIGLTITFFNLLTKVIFAI